MYIFLFPRAKHAMRSSSCPLAAEQHKFDFDDAYELWNGEEVPSGISPQKPVSFSLSGVSYFHVFSRRDPFEARVGMM